MTRMLKWMLPTLLGIGMHAWAGGGSIGGNGGDVVYCPTTVAGERRIELLDMFESRVLRKNLISLGQPGWSIEKRIQFVAQRLGRVDPQRGQVYKEQALRFLSDSEFTTNELPDIPDSMHIALPKGCVIRQIVIQTKDPSAGQKRFLINQELWDLLDDEGRTALIFHETIYREALGLGHVNSIATRAFNSALMSQSFDTFSMLSYVQFLNETAFSSYRIEIGNDSWVDTRDLGFAISSYLQGFAPSIHVSASGNLFGTRFDGRVFVTLKEDRIVLSILFGAPFSWPMDGHSLDQIRTFYAVKIDENGVVLAGDAVSRLEIKRPYYQIFCDPHSWYHWPASTEFEYDCSLASDRISQINLANRWVQIKEPTYTRWKNLENSGYKDGGDTSLRFDPKWERIVYASLFRPTELEIRSKTLTFDKQFETYESGMIHHGYLASSGELQVSSSSIWIVAQKGEVALREDGTVEMATLQEDTWLPTMTWREKEIFRAGTPVKFDEQGRANRVY